MTTKEIKTLDPDVLKTTEHVFSKNIDFTNTTLGAVCVEYFKKKIQLSSAALNPLETTVELEAYLAELYEYKTEQQKIKDSIKYKLAEPLDAKESKKICKILMISTSIMFFMFGTTALITGNLPLAFISVIDLFVFTIAYYISLDKK